jgi:tRNA pseudouridine55 synthase
MFGVLNLYKPSGPTSHDMISELRRLTKFKRIGHLGTLDPLAEGLLPVCFGFATRLIEYFPDDKVYLAKARLGQMTTTLDLEGEVLLSDPVLPDISLEALRVEASKWAVTLEYAVPHFSAVHFQGKKLYHYARQGTFFSEEDLPKKSVNLYALEVLDLTPASESPSGFPEMTFRLHCSTGTYVRAVAREFARAFGFCGATLTFLKREKHGLFSWEKALSLEAVALKWQDNQLGLENVSRFLAFPSLTLLSEQRKQSFLNGQKLEILSSDPDLKGNSRVQVLTEDGTLLGIACSHEGKWSPVKVLPLLNLSL